MSDLSIELELVSSECSLLLFLLKNLRQGVSTAVSSLSVSQHGDSFLEPVIIEPAIIEPVIIEPVEYRCIRR